MQIRQLQVAHDALQDRLLLRIATQADEEIRIWLTRRFLRELWPHLAKLLGAVNAPGTPLAAGATPGEPPSFEKPFRDEQATYPLGSTPLLTSEIKVDQQGDGACQMIFREGRERSFQLGLTPDLLQAFCAMLRAGAEQAQWGLNLDYAEREPARNATQPSSSRLH